ncbi:NADH:flavin oxidoreductase/NADH oxidase [Penicillium sp. IBT 35674x]|nr:NADH:flavin oxidoreductase/NADH oxidase [Penicillium sp. IBT 35674x]
MSKLFQPLQVGTMSLQHRISMAPLTRLRTGAGSLPLPFVKEYYTQRASVPGTLIVTEGINIDPDVELPVPSLVNSAQISSWRAVTDSVHAKGSFIVAQIALLGRAEPVPFDGKRDALAPSAIPIDAASKPPTPMTESHIRDAIEKFVLGARRAMEAGFDAVEIHGANGEPTSGGGRIENRSRFGIEVSKAVVQEIGAEKVGFRISPFSEFQAMRMEDPEPQFRHLVTELATLNLAYLHVVTARMNSAEDSDSQASINFVIEAWAKTRPVLIAGGMKPDSAKALMVQWEDRDVVVVFGRYFIANPDLPFRLRYSKSLNKWNRDTFYTPHAIGYIDYPFHPEFSASS